MTAYLAVSGELPARSWLLTEEHLTCGLRLRLEHLVFNAIDSACRGKAYFLSMNPSLLFYLLVLDEFNSLSVYHVPSGWVSDVPLCAPS